jgi:hypothetical protein
VNETVPLASLGRGETFIDPQPQLLFFCRSFVGAQLRFPESKGAAAGFAPNGAKNY